MYVIEVAFCEIATITKSTEAVHTSAKARLTRIHVRICDLDRHQNLSVCSLARCKPSVKI